MTGAHNDRRQLLKMLDILAPGDVVTVTRIDRLARSTFDLFDIVKLVIKVERGQDDGDHWLAIFARVGGEIRTAMGELEGEFWRILGEEG